MDTNNSKLFYSPGEFRQIIGCSRGLCYESLRQKKIHSFKLGRRIFIPASEVDRLRQLADDAGSIDNDDSILFQYPV